MRLIGGLRPDLVRRSSAKQVVVTDRKMSFFLSLCVTLATTTLAASNAQAALGIACGNHLSSSLEKSSLCSRGREAQEEEETLVGLRTAPKVVIKSQQADDSSKLAHRVASAKVVSRRHLSPTLAPARLHQSGRVALLDSEAEESLIELLAQLYAHTQVLQMRLELRQLAAGERAEILASGESRNEFGERFHNGSGGDSVEQREARRRMKMKLLGLDEESLGAWLREKQQAKANLRGIKFELLSELPNRTINICSDGPKILVVLPNVSDFLYCYTRDQWLEKLWSDLRPNYRQHCPFILLNFLIFLIGATGNVFVCLSVYRNHQLRNVTNYFIVNLAFADLLVILICLPATLTWDLTLTWFFGTHACKLVMFLQDVSISVSVLTLTAISLDRYYAICHPLKFKSSLSQAKRAIATIWLVSLLIMSPDLVYLAAHESQELQDSGLDTVLYSDCNYDWSPQASRAFQFIKTILLYLVPFMLMFVAHYTIMRTLRAACAISVAAASNNKIDHQFVYATSTSTGDSPRLPKRAFSSRAEDELRLETFKTNDLEQQPNVAQSNNNSSIMVTMHNRGQLKSRRKAAKMLTAIVVIFGLCYLPVHLINFLRQFIDNIPQTDATSTLAMLAHCLCYLNSAINPIIYNHMNSVFRAEFRQFLSSCMGCFGGGRAEANGVKQQTFRVSSDSQRARHSHLSTGPNWDPISNEIGADRTTSDPQTTVIELT